MSILLTTVLPALVPALSDGLKAIVGKFTGGAKPLSIAEQVQLMQAENERLKTLSELEGGGTSYPWVEAIRKLQRPFVVLVAMLVWAAHFSGLVELSDASTLMLVDVSSSVMFYLFGDRTWSYIKKGK